MHVPVGNVRLNAVKHVDGGLVELHEGGVVELAETEELEDLPGGGIHTHDTTQRNILSQKWCDAELAFGR